MSASGVVEAPPRRVYDLLANYRDEHPHILPPAYLGDLEVERGGVGAGTRIRFHLRVLGVTRVVRAEISEPEPGRVLAETDPETGAVTSFTVVPGPRAGSTELTIATEFPVRGGVAGALERWLVTRLLSRVYAAELAQVDAYVRDHPRAPVRT